jgi:hypothetical protein
VHYYANSGRAHAAQVRVRSLRPVHSLSSSFFQPTRAPRAPNQLGERQSPSTTPSKDRNSHRRLLRLSHVCSWPIGDGAGLTNTTADQGNTRNVGITLLGKDAVFSLLLEHGVDGEASCQEQRRRIRSDRRSVTEGDDVVVGRCKEFLAESRPLLGDFADLAPVGRKESEVPSLPVALDLRDRLLEPIEDVEPAADREQPFRSGRERGIWPCATKTMRRSVKRCDIVICRVAPAARCSSVETVAHLPCATIDRQPSRTEDECDDSC